MTERAQRAHVALPGVGSVPALVEIDGSRATAALLAPPIRPLAGIVGEDVTINLMTGKGVLRLDARIAAVPAPERMVLEVPGLVACEFIDAGMLRALDHMAPGVLPVDVEAALLIEVEALEEGIDRAIAVVVQCVEESGGSAREARSAAEIEIAWNARRSAYGALGRMHADSYTHDFATPRDRLVSSLRAATEIATRHGLTLSSVAHLGDGNLHPRLHYDAREPGAFQRALDASEELLVMVLENGGTLKVEKRRLRGMAITCVIPIKRAGEPASRRAND